MKTLADLKRDLKDGTKLRLIERDGKPINEERTLFKINSVDFIFYKPDGVNKSYLRIPKASLLEYDGKTIRIFTSGIRDLTEEERQIMANDPKDEKQEEIDALSDGSVMFRRRKRYYEEQGFEYLMGIERIQGKRLTHTKKGPDGFIIPQIEDDNLKGTQVLVYELIV